MQFKFVKCFVVTVVWTSLLLSNEAASPVCNTQPTGLFGYGQSCSYSSQCVTGICSYSICTCSYGTTYSPCAVACVADCQTTVTASSGAITSPGYPSSYPTAYCTWTIQGSPGTIIAFNITYIDMGIDKSCPANYLEIFDGSSMYSRSLVNACKIPQKLTLSTTNYMHVVFRTSGILRFLASFKGLGSPITLREPKGFIASPGYPLSYLDNMFYTWTIQGNADSYIVLNITDFLLEGNCIFDYLKIYDGPTNASSLFGNFCSSASPGLMASTSNYLFLQFKTDGSWRYKGFYGNYEIRGKSTKLLASAGDIASPSFPVLFLPNQVYSWTIQGNAGTFVVLKITTLNLSSPNSSCSNHHIQVYDGQNTSGVSLGRYCYSSSPVYIVSTSNYMHVVFRTDSTTTYQGFNSNYYTKDCTYYLDTTVGSLTSAEYPTGYSNNSTCSWNIIGDVGTRIFFNFTDFAVLPCDAAFLAAYDGQSPRTVLKVPRCGLVSQFSITSSNNFVFIAFITSELGNFVRYSGFKINYAIIDLSYGKSCFMVDQCKSYLTCVNGSCGCTTEQFYYNFTSSCYPKIDFNEPCSETQQCKSNLQCFDAKCSCNEDYYYSLIDVMCRPASNLIVQHPQTKNKNTNGVELQWEATTLGPNRTYGVSWVSASDETDRGTQAANESGVTVTGLTPGTSYTITVHTFLQQQGFYTARNVSTTVNIVTYPAKPGLVNTTASKLDKPPYIIRFQPSEGMVDNYRFSFESHLQLAEVRVHSPEVTLADLQADTEYNYSIKAVNSAGDECGEVKGSFKTANSEGKLDIGLIIGATVGSMVFLIIVLGVFIMVKRRMVKTTAEAEENPGNCTEDDIAHVNKLRPDNEYASPPEHVYDDVRSTSISKSVSQEEMYESIQMKNTEQLTTTEDESQHVYANFAFPH